MPRSSFLQSSFASGELSPLLKGRTDLEQYYAGVATAENVVIVPQGGMKRRPGTEHIGDAIRNTTHYTSGYTLTVPNGGTVSNLNDLDDSTTSVTTTEIQELGVGATEYVVANYNLSTQTTGVRFVDVRDIKLTIDNADTAQFKIQISSNGTAWTTLHTITVTSQPQNIRIRNTQSYSNIFPTPYVRLVRTGDTGDLNTQKVSLTDFNVYWETGSASPVKTFDFSIENDRRYLVVISQGNGAFYRIPYEGQTSTTFVGDIRLPYTAAQVTGVRDAQTENVMLLFHEEHPSKRIINDGASNADSFAVDNIPYLNVPQYDYFDAQSPTPTDEIQTLELDHGSGHNWELGDTLQIDIEGVLSKNITFAGDSNSDQISSTVFNIQKNLQEMPVFGESGVAVSRTGVRTYTITISGESTKAFELFSGFPTAGNQDNTLVFVKVQTGSPRKEDVWSATRGYPKMGAFHEGRLWLGGTRSKPQSLFASKSGSFFDYFFEEGDDDEGMFLTITARTLTDIVDINSDRGLQIFTTGAEFLVKNNTPSTVSIVAQTQHGASNLEVQSVDGATLFIDQNGRTLRQYLFSFNEDAYTSNDISVLSSQLIDNPQDVSILSGTTSEDANWVFIINQDGTGAVLNTVRSQDINGFTKWINGDTGISDKLKLASVTSVNNEMYIVNSRGGLTPWYFIERWSFDHLMDSSVKLSNVTTNVVNLGTDHLNNKVVSVLANGNTLPKRQVDINNGTITLTNEELSGGALDLEVGYNFVPKIVPMPLNTSSQASSQNAMREKKITRMNIRVYESANVYIDGNPVPVRAFGESANSPVGTPFEIKTGIIQDNNGGNGWGVDVVPVITVPDAAPFHIQAIEYEVESS
tara:strand:+ start:2498 stop:5089 length:2592 start_codon:yes stop_codon:yes gene_type:complete